MISGRRLRCAWVGSILLRSVGWDLLLSVPACWHPEAAFGQIRAAAVLHGEWCAVSGQSANSWTQLVRCSRPTRCVVCGQADVGSPCHGRGRRLNRGRTRDASRPTHLDRFFQIKRIKRIRYCGHGFDPLRLEAHLPLPPTIDTLDTLDPLARSTKPVAFVRARPRLLSWLQRREPSARV